VIHKADSWRGSRGQDGGCPPALVRLLSEQPVPWPHSPVVDVDVVDPAGEESADPESVRGAGGADVQNRILTAQEVGGIHGQDYLGGEYIGALGTPQRSLVRICGWGVTE
jgi:hypothetical protein